MDCDSCGCYRPSWEIAPVPDRTGHLVMACASCRGLVAGQKDPTRVLIDPAIVAGRIVTLPLPMT